MTDAKLYTVIIEQDTMDTTVTLFEGSQQVGEGVQLGHDPADVASAFEKAYRTTTP